MAGKKCVNRTDAVSMLGRREGLLLLCPQFGFCLLAAAFLVGSLPGRSFCSPSAFRFVSTPFSFCFPAAPLFVGSLPGLSLHLPLPFLFVGSPLGLGRQPPCFLLGLLPGSGLFHAPALFRRHPWLIQRFHDLLTEALDLLTDGGRLNIEMTQGTPIDILTPSDSRENGIIVPFGLVLERGNRNIENRENEVVSIDCFFASEERFKFKFAIFAVDRPRCDDGNEKDRLIYRGLDFQFPQLAWSNRRLILPQAEGLFGAPELSTQLSVDTVSQPGQRSFEGIVLLAGIAEESYEFRKFR